MQQTYIEPIKSKTPQ